MVKITEYFYKILENIVDNYKKEKSGRNKCGRKPTKDTKHYAKAIMKILSTGCQWNSLNDELHYSVYHKKYLEWNNNGLIQKFYNLLILINVKLYKMTGNYYIDSAIIRNMQGINDVSYNYKIKSKKGTKVSILVDSKGIPVSIHCVAANYSDVSLVLPNYQKIDDSIKKNIKNIICDAGYVSIKLKNKFKNEENINYIYPDKKNMLEKNKNTAADKKLIKTRNINEHSFSWMTQYRRLTARFEKYTNNFIGFITLAFCNIIINKLIKIPSHDNLFKLV